MVSVVCSFWADVFWLFVVCCLMCDVYILSVGVRCIVLLMRCCLCVDMRCEMLVVECGFLVVGCWLSVGCWRLVVVC